MPTDAPPLFGRESELAVVSECLDAAIVGHARALLCVGEPGIGKTRLAQAAEALAKERRFTVAWGIADDAAGTPPFWPWQQVFRALAASADLLGAAAEVRVTDHLGPLLPDAAARDEDGDARVTSPEARFRLFDSATTALRATARHNPLSLVLDDIHWADDASRLLLRHLVRSLRDDPIFLWVNTRPVEATRAGAFEQWNRMPCARRLDLAGLDDAAVRSQLELAVGAEVTDAEVAGVQSLTSGNPFFVSEAARTLTERRAGRRGPATSTGTRNAVAARVGRLPPASQAAVHGAAVIGREFNVGLVSDVVEATEPDCLAALAAAEQEGLVEPGVDGRSTYRFVHAIVRDAIEDGLGPSVRADLHARIAAALERRTVDEQSPQVFEIARHWAEAATAGERITAATWLERAANLALNQLAYEDALRLYRDALTSGGDELGPELRCRLLLGAARAANRSGALGECHALRTAAVDGASSACELEVLAEAALVMDPVGVAGFDLATRRLCQAVLDRLDDDASALRARITARFAETFVYLPDDDAADRASTLAITVAEHAGDVDALVASLRARQVVAAHPERLDERADVARRMLELAVARRDVDLELRARLCLVDVLFERGQLSSITAELDACEVCADELHSGLGRFAVRHTRAVQMLALGRLEEARRLSDAAISAADWGDHPDPPNRRAAVLSGYGRHAGVEGDAFDSLVPTETTPKPPFIGDLAAANMLALAGQRGAALDLWNGLGPPSLWHPPAHVVLLGAALGVETALALGRSDDVETVAKQLEPYRGHHVVCGFGAASYLGPVELWLGKTAARLGRLDQAVSDLQAASDLCRAAGAAAYDVEARYELATALAARDHPGDGDAARTLTVDCARAVDELGMGAFRERVAALAERLRGREADPLTRREREVAALVADGLSNREIAQRLVISERTAENHIQHIFTKLDLRNRAELVRWFTARPGGMSTESE